VLSVSTLFLFTVHAISTILCVCVSVFFKDRFHAIIVVPGFTMKVAIDEDLNTSFLELDSIHDINHSGIGDVFLIISGPLFLIVIFIDGFENKATVSPPLLSDILAISKSQSAIDMLKNTNHNIMIDISFKLYLI
jgi:hypothetical protein